MPCISIDTRPNALWLHRPYTQISFVSLRMTMRVQMGSLRANKSAVGSYLSRPSQCKRALMEQRPAQIGPNFAFVRCKRTYLHAHGRPQWHTRYLVCHSEWYDFIALIHRFPLCHLGHACARRWVPLERTKAQLGPIWALALAAARSARLQPQLKWDPTAPLSALRGPICARMVVLNDTPII